MCGIAGYVGFDRRGDALVRVQALLDAQVHRGPDDEGLLIFNRPAEDLPRRSGQDPPRVLEGPGSDHAAVVLGSRRLAILDRTRAGRQPMVTADGRYAILLNGEIYNYLELGRELEGAGHQFRSRTDTEVLLAAFVQWGPESLSRLAGMYAFVVLDTVDRRVFCARDVFGIKPLYLVQAADGLVFASEVSALVQWPGVRRGIAPQPLHDYLDRGLVEAFVNTLFEGIRALPPAHFAEIDLRDPMQVTPTRYWALDSSRTADLSFEDAVRQLRDLFAESIAFHLRSDVPVGALLSGGTDSSSVVMAMREVGGASFDIHTFSYVGGHGAPSEEPWIDIVNAAAGAVPHKLDLDPGDFVEDLDALVRAQDMPFGSIAVYAQHRLFREAKAVGVPVVLSGTGSDETQAGYPDFGPARVASLIRGGDLRTAIDLVRQLTNTRRQPRRAALRVLRSGIMLAMPRALQLGIKRWRRRSRLIDHHWRKVHQLTRRSFAPTGSKVLSDLVVHQVETGLPDLLRYEDRNSMAASVEARVPFLNRRLVEFTVALPEQYLFGPRGQEKHVLKEAMRGLVPDAVLDRPRMGFPVPLHTWPAMIPGLPESLEAVMLTPGVNRATVQSVVDQLRVRGTVEPHDVFGLWRLFGLAAWAERFQVPAA